MILEITLYRVLKLHLIILRVFSTQEKNGDFRYLKKLILLYRWACDPGTFTKRIDSELADFVGLKLGEFYRIMQAYVFSYLSSLEFWKLHL